MPGTDFFDDDLTTSSRPREARTPPREDEPGPSVSAAPQRAVSDLNLTGMVRRKEEMERQVADASMEIERLRKRQDDLERERRELEDLRRKQDEFESGRREIVERLDQSLIVMEKEQFRAERLAELLATTRVRFKALLSEVRGIDEESWGEEDQREELNKALVILDGSRTEYNKALARVEAAMAEEPHDRHVPHPLLPGEAAASAPSFGRLLAAGLALSLPLILTALLLAGAAAAFLLLGQP